MKSVPFVRTSSIEMPKSSKNCLVPSGVIMKEERGQFLFVSQSVNRSLHVDIGRCVNDGGPRMNSGGGSGFWLSVDGYLVMMGMMGIRSFTFGLGRGVLVACRTALFRAHGIMFKRCCSRIESEVSLQ
ncbi:uncharacterized protein EV154DRAFT_554734 [Mucor mucedo]|uniref:uncharacterized protein n=1 Tax=Mucor mucedo TaxID=29922 RepID=UPI00221E4596|nr:uncharacterized protein EV154DRAFT_554734 [Mucor mucedo]KAI7885955.1 hypothetical protein EV154DRAFT_554734 [Mucor mucedo]